MEEIRKQLKEFIDYKKGESLRKQLNEYAVNNYEQKHSDSDYVDFMERNTIDFSINHPQSKNHPYYYTMFSCKTQHLMGDCVREILDKAIDIEKRLLK